MSPDETLSNKQLDKMEETLNKTDALLRSSDNVELGKMLVSEAKTVYDKERQAKVLGEVKRLMQCRDEAKALMDLQRRSHEWFSRKLKAIENGEFEFTDRGEIFMNDEDLRRGNF